MNNLKPCPICGGKAKIVSWYINGVANKKHYRVECSASGCIVQKNEYKNEERAIYEWNRRSLPDKQSEDRDIIEADISVFMDMQPLYEVADGWHEIDLVKDVEKFIIAYAFAVNNFLIEETTKRLKRTYNDYLTYRHSNENLFLNKENKELFSWTIADYVSNKNNWKDKYTENMYKAVFCNLVLIFQLCDEDFRILTEVL